MIPHHNETSKESVPVVRVDQLRVATGDTSHVIDIGAPLPHVAAIFDKSQIISQIIRTPTVADEQVIKKNMEDLRAIQDLFARSSNVLIEAENMGLGDDINAVRAAFALARVCPEKGFVITLREKIARMRELNIPNNVTIGSAGPEARRGVDLGVSLYGIGHTHLFAANEQPPWLSFTSDDLAYRALAKQEFGENGTVSIVDYERYYTLRALGADMQPKDLYEPMVRTDRLVHLDHRWDVLLIPEARERQLIGTDRSAKSISADRWEEIFAEMKARGFRGRVGVVAGQTAPRYVHEVYTAVKSQNQVGADLVVTPDLDAFCQAVASSGMVVGMDTGPMHLAADVIRGLHGEGIDIGFRHIFNEILISRPRYQLALPGHPDARALYYNPIHIPVTVPGRSDIKNLDPQRVAEFITS